MTTPQLINYVRQQTAAGAAKEMIAKNLAQNGWSPQDIADTFAAVATPASATSVPAPLAAQKTKPSSTTAGRKMLISSALVAASALYAFFQYSAQAQQQLPVATTSVSAPVQNPPIDSAVVTVSQTPAPTSAPQKTSAPAPTPASTSKPVSTPVQTPTPTQTPAPAPTPTPTPVPTPTPAPKPAGQYVDGTYTGSSANAYYGTVQIKATIQNGALANVQFLQYPSDRSTSRRINSQAMPMLISEALQVQSASVDIVSGATDTSQAFQQSLGSALAMAKN